MRFGGEPEMDQRVAAANGARSSPVNARTPSPAPRRPTDDSLGPDARASAASTKRVKMIL